MENGVSIETVLRYGLITLGLFALIYLMAVLTPWMAKHVDSWIARYRENHDPKRDRTYGVRSIYELPPKEDGEQETAADKQESSSGSHGEPV